jgi:RNA polymerase sigma factor (sigma-70 family)
MSTDLFTQRVLPMKDKLFRFAFRLLQNAQEAEDAVQEVLVKIWMKRGEWDRWENMEGYCMTITRNHCLDRLKVHTAHRVEVSAAAHLRSGDRDPAEKVQDKDLRNRVRQCMEALPEKHQLVMQLREMEGLSYQEIAAALSLSVDQVKINLHRARNAVKEVLIKDERIWNQSS